MHQTNAPATSGMQDIAPDANQVESALAVGLGVLAPYEDYIAKGVQVLFVVALIGQIVAYREHQNGWLLSLSALVTVLLFSGYYIVPSSLLLQVSLLGLAISSIWLVVEQRRCAKYCAPPT